MTLSFIRSFFLIISMVVGYYIGEIQGDPILGAEIGALVGLLIIFLENQFKRVSVQGLTSMVFGLLLGVFMAKLLADILLLLPLGEVIQSIVRVILTLIFSYLGAVMALRGKDEFNIIIPYVRFRRQDVKDGVILIDTSAIIDGRVIDIYKINFIAGRLVLPRSGLHELQQIADSFDDIKRQKGRRGLDLLHLMQNDPRVDIHIHEDGLTSGESVDERLIRLSKIMDARLCTTDFNLSRIAALQGVSVLNIHELANAVKSVVYNGEHLEIRLLKEGKEHNQAVGYLDDGTMIVVSDGQSSIGKKVSIIVTSVLQTQSGKMIFAKVDNNLGSNA
jgi:uncharacterized protein YacL